MSELTKDGLVISRQPEIVEDLIDAYRENIDPNIEVRDDEFFGQQTEILAFQLSQILELVEAVNNSQNPLTAEGSNLDDVGALALVPRQGSSRSRTTTQRFTEENGFILPQGTKLENPVTLDRFSTLADLNISTNNCVEVEYSVLSVLNSTIYQLNINGTDFTYTSDVDATEQEIVDGLKAVIDLSTFVDFTTSTIIVESQPRLVISAVNNKPFSVFSPAFLLAELVTVIGVVEADVVGDIAAPANSVTRMVTSSSVVTTNPTAYTTGRLREADKEYRERILSSGSSSGKATVEAIQDAVSLVDGVTVAIVLENDTNVVDADGRPPHSFETVVAGGLLPDIGEAVLRTKPAGIQTFGNTNILVQDKYGNDRDILITRPNIVNIAFRVRYTKHSETVFPSDGQTLITDSILSFTNGLSVGRDVIPLDYFGLIYEDVGSLESLVVEIQELANQGDAPNPVAWQTTKLPISVTQFANTTLADIDVAEA